MQCLVIHIHAVVNKTRCLSSIVCVCGSMSMSLDYRFVYPVKAMLALRFCITASTLASALSSATMLYCRVGVSFERFTLYGLVTFQSRYFSRRNPSRGLGNGVYNNFAYVFTFKHALYYLLKHAKMSTDSVT